jgi:hypothetical protein
VADWWGEIKCTPRVEPRPFGVSRIAIYVVGSYSSYSPPRSSQQHGYDHPPAQVDTASHFLNRRQMRHVYSRETRNNQEPNVAAPSLLHHEWLRRWLRILGGACDRSSSSVLSEAVVKGWAWVARDDRGRCRRVGWDLARGSGRICHSVSVGLLCLCARDEEIGRSCGDESLMSDEEMDDCGSEISRLNRCLTNHRRIFDRLWRMCWRWKYGEGCWTRSLSLVAAFLPWVVDAPSPNLWAAADVGGHSEVVEES